MFSRLFPPTHWPFPTTSQIPCINAKKTHKTLIFLGPVLKILNKRIAGKTVVRTFPTSDLAGPQGNRNSRLLGVTGSR